MTRKIKIILKMFCLIILIVGGLVVVSDGLSEWLKMKQCWQYSFNLIYIIVAPVLICELSISKWVGER